MTIDLASDINDRFQFHRQVCKVCASSGPAVCRVGMELLRMFHAAIVEETLQELRDMRAEKARA